MLGILELPAKINSFFAEETEARKHVSELIWLDQTFSGRWTSDTEGVLGIPEEHYDRVQTPGEPVDLDLRVYDGELSGEISSGGLEEAYVFSHAMLKGVVRKGELWGEVWDYVGGRPNTIAHFKLFASTEGGKEVLRFQLMQQAIQVLPETAVLWRTEAPLVASDSWWKFS